MTDPRFTLPESPELMARAEAVARQRYEDWTGFTTGPGCWDRLALHGRGARGSVVADELRDLTRPASYDAAIRWLGALVGGPDDAPHWLLAHFPGGWELHCYGHGRYGDRLLREHVPTTITDPREALCLTLTAALEARRV